MRLVSAVLWGLCALLGAVHMIAHLLGANVPIGIITSMTLTVFTCYALDRVIESLTGDQD